MEVMSDKKIVRRIQRGLRDVREGKYREYKDVESLFADLLKLLP